MNMKASFTQYLLHSIIIMFKLKLIYIYDTFTFIRRFYPKRLTIAFRLYIFISTCVLWESNPQPFAQLTQRSTTEPHVLMNIIYIFNCMSKTYRHVARKKTDTLLWLQINNLLPQVLGKLYVFFHIL